MVDVGAGRSVASNDDHCDVLCICICSNWNWKSSDEKSRNLPRYSRLYLIAGDYPHVETDDLRQRIFDAESQVLASKTFLLGAGWCTITSLVANSANFNDHYNWRVRRWSMKNLLTIMNHEYILPISTAAAKFSGEIINNSRFWQDGRKTCQKTENNHVYSN